MILFEQGRQPAGLFISDNEDSAVRIAAENLASDIEKVCHVRPALTNVLTGNERIVIGTRGVSDAVDNLRWDAVTDETGQPRWEGYLQQARDGRLYLAGNDRRGTVYAIYTLSEAIGVSPWYDFADVPPREKQVIDIPDTHFLADWPCVTYRGIFLNDEEELDAWAKAHTGDGTIGPETYRRVFELLLRLKGNFIWPAMHVNAFNMNPENNRLAHRMGVVTGTSHCDMLHRSNQNEWKPWGAAKGYDGLQYDYTIPGQNRERLLEYWRESLEQNRDFECCYTIGMRGIHDSGFIASGLDENASPEEVMAAKRALLEEIMDVQRRLIREVVPREHVPQSFVPYKEVLPIYDSGLRVPEDVTLIWVNDNHGHVRRYPNEAERRRPGGHGLYYHSSYWAPPGMSYLFLGSTPPQHMANELKKCWEQGIRRIWVDNVGALKPLEQDAEYFLRYAWDAGRPDSHVHDPRAFTEAWIDRYFTGHHGREVADICVRWAQLNNLCKPEHMRSNVFSQTSDGDEAAARLLAMEALTRRCEAVWRALPDAERDAFYELMLMKLQASLFISASYYYADRSLLCYERGAMRGAEVYTAKSRAMDDLKRMLLHDYNRVLRGGKWSGILTPEDFPPPTLELYPRCRPALTLEKGRLLVTAGDWGEANRLTFDAFGQPVKWIALMNTGTGAPAFRIEAPEGLTISRTEGTISVEERVMVEPDAAFSHGVLRIVTEDAVHEIEVVREGEANVPAGCLTDGDGAMHLAAADCADRDGFRVIPDLGRGAGAALEAVPETSPERPARLRFTCFLRRPCAPTLELIRFLTLNSTGSLRFRVTVDGAAFPLVSPTTDEWRGNWVEAATRNGEKLTLALPELSAGRHAVTVEALDPYLTLSAVNLYTRPPRPSLLGPGVLDTRVDIPDISVEAWQAFFPFRPDDVPPPNLVVADDDFWTQDMLYARNKHLPIAGWHAAQDAPEIVDRLTPLAGAIEEDNGFLRWPAAKALLQTQDAWQTPDARGTGWIHRQAESDGRNGLAMCLPMLGKDIWQDAELLPSLHYRFRCGQDAMYHLWLLMKYDDACGFHCRFLLDGQDLADIAPLCRNHFHTFRTAYAWGWHKLASVRLTPGEHVLTIGAVTSGMAIDQLALTTAD